MQNFEVHDNDFQFKMIGHAKFWLPKVTFSTIYIFRQKFRIFLSLNIHKCTWEVCNIFSLF
jgi:hypothetical protein